MEEFYIDVELSQGLTRIQVDEVPPEQWDMPYAPQFIIELHNGSDFITLTLLLDQGQWFDREKRLSGGELPLYFPNQNSDENPDPYYQSPISDLAIKRIGQAIGRHMIVHLTAYMALFIPVFRAPELN